jgi:XTP/dITP diphosphohydrolase
MIASPGPPRALLLATTNTGKLREIAGILDGLPIPMLTLGDRLEIAEPEETGQTFAENARLKALYYAAASGMLSVADDSGLEIEALDNAPGVHSARWQGSDYAIKFRRIQDLLHERGVSRSPARFVCHVALARDGEIVFESEGIVRGETTAEPRGMNGFGYDPIFFYPPLGRTLAELNPAEKAAISHRGQAFAALREYLLAHPDLTRS